MSRKVSAISGDAQLPRPDPFQINNTALAGKMYVIPCHFHLQISTAGGLNLVQPGYRLNLLQEAPQREIDNSKPEMTISIVSSHAWKMITW